MEPVHYQMGRGLFLIGAALLVVGLLLMYGPKIPWLGRLPGDIHIQREHFQFYFPLTTCMLLSALAWIVMRFFR